MSLKDKAAKVTNPDAVEFAEFGDNVEGVVIDVQHDVQTRFGSATIAQIQRMDGSKRSLFLSSAGLKALANIVSVGDMIYVEYVADEPTPNGPMKSFIGAIERDGTLVYGGQ